MSDPFDSPIRCPATGKKIFLDATAAKAELGRTTAMNVYMCRFAAHWHVGHRRGQAKGSDHR